MEPEIASAASHVASLLTNKPPSTPTLQRFKTSLAESLQARYSSKWSPTDPERGSATRALHWQPGPGGEGCSSPLVKLCDQFPEADFGDREWTVWVDPGCVAIREGPGPGRASSTMTASTSAGAFPSPSVARSANNVNLKASTRSPETVRVLYGRVRSRGAAPQPTLQQPVYNRMHSPLAINQAGPTMARSPLPSSSLVPSVNVCPSTPAVVSPDTTPLVPWTTGNNGAFPLHSSALRSRRSSNATNSSAGSGSTTTSSMAAGSNIFMSRNDGLSADTVSSSGTSIPAQSPGLPSEWSKLYSFDHAAPAESKVGAYEPTMDSYNMEAELQGLGLGDILLEGDVDVAPEDAIDERIEADESDERCNEGDDTLLPLDSGDATLKEVQPTVEEEDEDDVEDKSSNVILRGHQSRPSTSSVTSFDNGNVGVLGGGIKLGGSSSSASSNKSRSRAHSTTSNGSSTSGHFGRQQQQQQHQRGHSKSKSSIHARTDGWAAQQQQQQYQHPYDQAAQQQRHQAHQQQQMMGLMNANFASLPPQQQQRPFDMAHQYQYGPQMPFQMMTPAVAPPLLRTNSAPAHQLPTAGQYQTTARPVLADRRDNQLQSLQQQPQLHHKRSMPFGASKQSNMNTPNLSLGSFPTPKIGSGHLALPSPALSTATSKSGGSSYCSSTESYEGEDGPEDDSLDDDDENAAPGTTTTTRRTRTRGRRSRGRGTGRAARRAAALNGGSISPALPVAGNVSPLPPMWSGMPQQQHRLPPPMNHPLPQRQPLLSRAGSFPSNPAVFGQQQQQHAFPSQMPRPAEMYARAW